MIQRVYDVARSDRASEATNVDAAHQYVKGSPRWLCSNRDGRTETGADVRLVRGIRDDASLHALSRTACV